MNQVDEDLIGPALADRRFQAYDKRNPQVYQRFKQLALVLQAKGRKRVGAKLIMERIRWDTVVSGDDSFKINNNYTSRYVRKLIEEMPVMRDLFATRELRA